MLILASFLKFSTEMASQSASVSCNFLMRVIVLLLPLIWIIVILLRDHCIFAGLVYGSSSDINFMLSATTIRSTWCYPYSREVGLGRCRHNVGGVLDRFEAEEVLLLVFDLVEPYGYHHCNDDNRGDACRYDEQG